MIRAYQLNLKRKVAPVQAKFIPNIITENNSYGTSFKISFYFSFLQEFAI